MQLDLFDQPLPHAITRLTFNQGMRLFQELHWFRTRQGKNSESLCRYIVVFFEGRSVDNIGRQDTFNLLAWLRTEKKQGGWSLIKARAIVRLMYNKLELWKEDGIVGPYDFTGVLLPRKNPTFKVPTPKPPKPQLFISPFEFRGWIKAARKAGDVVFEAAFRFALWFRLSPIDLENLNDDEIDEQAFEIRLFRRHTKTALNPGGCPQTIELTEKAWALINRCRQHRRPGEKLILNMVNKRRRFAKIRKIAREMGLRDITLSVFRRSASDHLMEQGFSKEAVADSLGHTTEKIVDFHYASKKRAPFRRQVTEELTTKFT